MGRTLASSTQLLIEEQQSFQNFRRALRRQHQIALDEMFASARKHTPAMAMAGHALPFETILLAMLLEEHVTNKQLRQDIDQLIGLIQQLMDAAELPGKYAADSCPADEYITGEYDSKAASASEYAARKRTRVDDGQGV